MTRLLMAMLIAGCGLGFFDDVAAAEARPAVADKVPDRFTPALLEGQRIEGMLGERMRANLELRLLRVNQKGLLGGYQQRPGSHPWIGEHIGKFLHAASLTRLQSGDARIAGLADSMANALIATQLPDGYLGTYAPEHRWTSWDVWSHKYNLIGLLSHHQATGSPEALEACRRMGDLLCATFGDGEGQRDIIRSGTHVGMAPTSVLEPMCELYRRTGDRKYLDFCFYILRAWEQPHGPKIISTLLETGNVHKTANGKAYEMLSNLVGLLELYRITSEPTYLKVPTIAWEDITARRLYITGTASAAEHFQDDHDLPADGTIGEGCVTTTWLQLNWHLLRLTGEARYAHELEKTVYNHLLGAQDPTNGNCCYYMGLSAPKPFSPGINCCVSSLPRGIAMIPQFAWGALDGGVMVNLYAPGEAAVVIAPGLRVKVTSRTQFPQDGQAALAIDPSRPAEFPVALRVPAWTDRFTASVGGSTHAGKPGELLVIRRTWQAGDRIDIQVGLPVRVLPGGRSYPNRIAIQRGPQVLALEQSMNADVPRLSLAAAATPDRLELRPLSRLPENWPGRQGYAIDGVVSVRQGGSAGRVERELVLVPFADARWPWVWLLRDDRLPAGPVPVTFLARESYSRRGDCGGSFSDGQVDTWRRTFDYSRNVGDDWYALEWDRPAKIGRVVYAHGRHEARGGWFDTTEGKPRIQIKATADGPWETVATLESYPDAPGVMPDLKPGQRFEARLPQPVQAVGLRIIGKPGFDVWRVYFSSIAELAGYEE